MGILFQTMKCVGHGLQKHNYVSKATDEYAYVQFFLIKEKYFETPNKINRRSLFITKL